MVLSDYSCDLQKDILVQGRLYIAQNHVCFYANIFHWKIVISHSLGRSHLYSALPFKRGRGTNPAVIPSHFSLSTAFFLHLSSPSVFLTSLFTQSPHHNCGLSLFLRPRRLAVYPLLLPLVVRQPPSAPSHLSAPSCFILFIQLS